MANVFISYGDDRFKLSLDRITRQARKSKRFDRVIKYTPKDLPEYIRSSPLFSEPIGGGYWCWKPFVISSALSQCKNGDVVYYADAGCSIVADSPEWDVFAKYLRVYSAVFFQYRKDFLYPGWEQYCPQDSPDKTAIKHWMKPTLVEYFERYGDPAMLEFDSLWAGFIIIKKTEARSAVLDEWRRIMLMRPDLVIPPFGSERNLLSETFFCHRCDQSILSPLVCHYQIEDNVVVLPETSESQIGQPAILATRWRQAALPPAKYLKYRMYNLFHCQ